MELKSIGQKIKLAREAAHITQEQLANTVSCTVQHISALERGIKIPSLEMLITIANAIDVSADFLLEDVILTNTSSLSCQCSEVISKMPEELRIRIMRAIIAFGSD